MTDESRKELIDSLYNKCGFTVKRVVLESIFEAIISAGYVKKSDLKQLPYFDEIARGNGYVKKGEVQVDEEKLIHILYDRDAIGRKIIDLEPKTIAHHIAQHIKECIK